MFTANVSIKAFTHLSGDDLAGSLRAIADELEEAMEDAPAESTHQDAVIEFHGRPTIAWTLEV